MPSAGTILRTVFCYYRKIRKYHLMILGEYLESWCTIRYNELEFDSEWSDCYAGELR